MKKTYIIPALHVVVLQQQCQILAGSGGLSNVNSIGIDSADDLDINDNELGDGFYGR